MGLLRFGGFTLDRANRTLSRSGSPVAVQDKVFACIEALASRPRELISIAQLRHTLWPDVHVGGDALRRVIRDARRALGDTGDSQRVILTRKGVGYVFLHDVESVERDPVPPPTWPFVGRATQLSALRAALSLRSEDPGPCCIVRGEAGSGKSALLRALQGSARDVFATWCVGHCHAGSDIPAFWPFREIARQLVQLPRANALIRPWLLDAPALGRLLPELRSSAPNAVRSGGIQHDERAALCRAFAELLRHVSTFVPLLIVVEDVHAADTGTLLILEQLARANRTRSLGVLATCRPDQLDHAAITVLQPFRPVDLPALTQEELQDLLGRLRRLDVTPSAARSLEQLTGGNALFTRQLLEPLGAADPPIPVRATGTLQQVILARVARLPPETRANLQRAAVLGQEFEPALLAAMAGEPLPLTAANLLPAIESRLVCELGQNADRFAFEHALIRDALYDSLEDGFRCELHREALHALELNGDDPEQLDALATHAHFAGERVDCERALSRIASAGLRAFEHLAFDRALTHLTRALPLAREAASEREAELAVLLARARWFADEPLEEVAEACRSAAEIARRAGSPELFARAAISCAVGEDSILRLGMVQRNLGDLRLLEEALALLPNESRALRHEVARTLAWLYPCFGDGVASATAARLALATAPPDQDERTQLLSASLFWCADPDWMWNSLDVIDDQLQHPELGSSLCAELALRTAVVYLMLGEIGRFERALVELDRALRAWPAVSRIGRLGHRHALFTLVGLCFRITRAVIAGDFEEAERRLAALRAEGVRLAVDWGPRRDEYNGLLMAFQVFAYQGRAHAIEPLFERHLEAYPIDEWLVDVCRAHCALERGDRARACRLYARLRATAFRRPLEGGAVPVRIETRLRLADLCTVLGNRTDAAFLYDALLPAARFCGGESYVYWGSIARALGELSLQLGELERARDHFIAALAMNERVGHRPELARTRMGLARAQFALGEPGEAQRLVERASAEAAQMKLGAVMLGPLPAAPDAASNVI